MADDSDRSHRESRQKRAAAEVARLLECGRGAEALEVLNQMSAQRLLPDGPEVHEWLVGCIGEEMTVQLIRTYAQSPCFFCRGGLQPCEECESHGHFNYTQVCESCMGLGVCRCYFCNGSGWSNIDHVPAGLRVPVVLERARAAIKRTRKLLAELPVELPQANPRDSMRDQVRLILRLNGLLGVLENELSEARSLHWWTPHSEAWVTQTVHTWVQVAGQAETRMCRAFQCLSEIARRIADESVEGSDARRLSLARARYFSQFDRPDALELTNADHPVLDRLVEELGDGRKLKKTGS